MRTADFRRYVGVLRSLLDGGEAEFEFEGTSRLVAFCNRDQGFTELGGVPLVVAAVGPRSIETAGMYGDGWALGGLASESSVLDARPALERGAAAVGRTLDPGFRQIAQSAVCVLEHGESLGSQRVVEECGPYVIARFHGAYDRFRRDPESFSPPAPLARRWEEYVAYQRGRGIPPERVHQDLYPGHCAYVPLGERRFVEPSAIEAYTLVGGPSEIVERLRDQEARGITDFVHYPPMATSEVSMRSFATAVMSHFRA